MLPLERIIGRTDPDNVASRTVMERLGFELIGPVDDQVTSERRSLDGQRASEEER
jgi:RimJ/RimL family protein N-acetyltransferase